jgi:hypothetical protein
MKTFDQKRSFNELKEVLESSKCRHYRIEEIVAAADVMGQLLGCQFDCPERGGYVYFWDTGLVGRQLMDYVSGKELIPDATSDLDERGIAALMSELAAKL